MLYAGVWKARCVGASLCFQFLTSSFRLWRLSLVRSSAAGESPTGRSLASWLRCGSLSCPLASLLAGRRWWATPSWCALCPRGRGRSRLPFPALFRVVRCLWGQLLAGHGCSYGVSFLGGFGSPFFAMVGSIRLAIGERPIPDAPLA